MDRTALSVALILTMTVLVAITAVGGPTPAPVDGQRISSDQAAAIAVNEVTELGAGYRLRHPDRAVDFTPQGVRVEGVRGAPEWTWSLEAVASASGRALVALGPVAPMAVERTLIRTAWRCSWTPSRAATPRAGRPRCRRRRWLSAAWPGAGIPSPAVAR